MTAGALVSVVIPVYNRAYCIVDAVRSVLDQTHPHVECLVIDDGSTDDTVRILREEFADDGSVRVLTQAHAGVSAARNLGIRHATGRFVTFLDSDDLMVPERVERQLGAVTGDSVAVIGRQEQVLAGPATRPAWLEQHPEWWEDYYHTSVLVETRRIRDLGGFDESLELGEDLDLVARLAGAGIRVVPLDEIVVIRRYFGDNVTYAIEADGARRALLRAVRGHLTRTRSGDGAALPGPLSLDVTRTSLDEAARTWRSVQGGAPVTVRRMRVAHTDLEVVVCGDDLAQMLLPAFDGLPEAEGPPRAVIGAWDTAATGFGFPPRPPFGAPGRYRSTVRRNGEPVAEVEWASPDVFRAVDRDSGCHLLAVRSALALSAREGGAPLRRQLQWSLGPEFLFVHAGAVGSGDGVALLVGPGGAGKSSTAIACLRAGMGFLSDDYCVVTGDPPVAHQIYSTARVFGHDVDRFGDVLTPSVDASPVDAESTPDGKALYHVHSARPEQTVASAPVALIVVLELAGERRPQLQPVGRAEALRRIAPSTLWQMSLDPRRELTALARLVSGVPCQRLILSPDRAANPPLILEALQRVS